MVTISESSLMWLWCISIVLSVFFGFLAGYIKYYISHKVIHNKKKIVNELVRDKEDVVLKNI